MKYIREYKEIDFNDWDEEEEDPNLRLFIFSSGGNYYLAYVDIDRHIRIFYNDYDFSDYIIRDIDDIRIVKMIDVNNKRILYSELMGLLDVKIDIIENRKQFMINKGKYVVDNKTIKRFKEKIKNFKSTIN